jgi:predicted peptidase
VGLGPAIMLAPDRWPFLVVFPQKPRDRHGWLEHEELALGALARTRDEWTVDPARLYLTGVSLGGFGSWTMGARRRDLFAAIAPVCGGGDPEDSADLASLPTWAFHGEADTVVSPRHSVRMAEAVRAAGGDPKLTLYPGVGHDSWDRAYREERVPEWLLEQRL